MPRSFRPGFRACLATIGAAALLVLGLDYVSLAANGSSILLGRVNGASALTTLDRSAPGPVLRLRPQPGSPPLSTGSSKRVKNLNADRVDGLEGGALARRSTVSGVNAPACTPATNVGTAYKLVTNLGIFGKVRGDSTLQVSFGPTIALSEPASNGIVLQLRVGSEPVDEVHLRNQAILPVFLHGFVQDVPAGTHALSLWARTTFGTYTGTVTQDPYCLANSYDGVARADILEFH